MQVLDKHHHGFRTLRLREVGDGTSPSCKALHPVSGFAEFFSVRISIIGGYRIKSHHAGVWIRVATTSSMQTFGGSMRRENKTGRRLLRVRQKRLDPRLYRSSCPAQKLPISATKTLSPPPFDEHLAVSIHLWDC
jgi:hypothetical protein